MSSERAPSTVQVSTGSRLHFGPLSYRPVEGRHFGGIGLMLAQPGWSIVARTVDQGDADIVTGQEVERVQQILKRFRQQAASSPPVHLEINETIPSHHGLGSGTQLSLAVGECLTRLAGGVPDVSAMALLLGRGSRSAIGLYGYETGGFLVDAGQSEPGDLGGLACRVAVPEAWRFVLVSPEQAAGLSGEAESRVLQELAPMNEQTMGRLSRLTLTEMLPALQAQDCERFAAALEEYGRHVGEFFRAAQGDVFAHPAMAELAEQLLKAGVSGMAQSSWGPTLAIPVNGIEAAEDVQQRIRQLSRSPVVCQIAAPLNQGRSVKW